jgi:hypothetical protein
MRLTSFWADRPFVHADREIGLRKRDIDHPLATKLDEPDLAFAGKLIREAVRDISPLHD